MSTKRIDELCALETEVNKELRDQAAIERAKGLHKNWPITDGVVEKGLHLATSPKLLWILKEPWEEDIEEMGGGDWSVTKDLIPKKLREKTIVDRGLYANMAWVTFSVLNGFQTWQQLPYISNEPKVAESLLMIAYINISKYPGGKVSYPPFLKDCYRRNRAILLRQIATIAPDIIIGGNTLPLFFDDLGLSEFDFTQGAETVKVCYKDRRLYIGAYHPAYRGSSEKYVGDIVAAIKPFRQNWEHTVHGTNPS